MPPAVPARELFVHEDPDVVSAWCRERLVSGAVLVTPSAAARRQALRALVDRAPVAVGVTIAARGRLLPLLESRAGVVVRRPLTPELERLLAREAGAAARLPLFEEGAGGARASAGAVRALVRLVRALRLNGVTPEAYAAAGGDPGAAEACQRFDDRRRALGLEDEADRVERLIAVGVPALDLVLDEPHVPHRAAERLLEAAIASARSCAVGLAALRPGGPPLRAWLESLDFGATARPVAVAEHRAPSAALRAVGGAGVHDEVALVAREMLALLRAGAPVPDESAPGGMRPVRPADILGVAPTAAYLDALHEACAGVGLPVASPRRRPVLDVPLVRALLETFRLLADPEADTPERGLALLGTPYLGLTLREHDRLARVLVRRGLGALRTWRTVAATVGVERPRFRRFAEDAHTLAARLQGDRAPRELGGILATLALDHAFLSNGRRFQLAAGRDECVRVDQQGWDALTAAVERLNDALRLTGVTRIAARRWLHELEELLAGEAVRVEAKARDGVHLTIAGAGLPPAVHVFAVGWREGLVPRRLRDEPLLPEAVMRRLNESGARFPLGADRAGAELERRERVRRAARVSLTISWPAVDEEGNPQLPSHYLDELGIGSRRVRAIGDPTWPLPLAASRAERLTRATVLAKHRTREAVGDELSGVRDALAGLTAAERRRWSGALHAGPTIVLPPEVLAEAAPFAEAMSASQARQLAHCQYEHFGKKRLRLERLGLPVMDVRRSGSIAHRVLAEVGRRGWPDGLVEELLEAEWRALEDGLRDDAAAAFERRLLREQLVALVAAERQREAEGRGRARWFELAFGVPDGPDGDRRDPASLDHGLWIDLPAGSPIPRTELRGSIDRVDVLADGETPPAVAIDYKTGGGKSYAKELQEFADFQLPIYHAVLERFGVQPVGVCYLGIATGERHGVIRKDFADQFLSPDDKGVRRLGADEFEDFMRQRLDALREHVAALGRGEIAVAPRNGDCKYCDLRPVCRIGTFGVGGANGDD